MTTHRFVYIATLALATVPAFSQQILTRADLNNYLAGGASYTDDFEANVGLSTGASELTALNTLDSTSTFTDNSSNSRGPNLIGAGASYLGTNIQWNGDQYFQLNTQTIDSGWGVGLTIAYTNPVQAIGVDLMDFDGYSGAYTFDVYNGAALLGTINGSTNGTSAIFNGWKNSGGITSVVITTTTNHSWSPIIDNSEYGTQAVPEPSSLAMLGIAGLGLLFKRRR